MEDNSDRDGYVAASMVDTRCQCAGVFAHCKTPLPGESLFCYIGKDDEPEYKCYPYKLSRFRYVLMILVDICTAGFMWLMFYWRPDWKLKFTHYPTTFDKLDSVFLEMLDGTQRVFVSEVEEDDATVKNVAPFLFVENQDQSLDNYSNDQRYEGYQNDYPTVDRSDGKVKYFYHQLMRYIWEENLQTFVKVEGFDGNVTFQHIHDSAERALSKAEQSECLKLYGKNTIHVEVTSYLRLLISEVLNPFYVFQMFACIFWFLDEYVAYATAIVVISFISAIISLITIRRERQALHDMVELNNNSKVTVVREIKVKEAIDGPSSSNGLSMTKEYVTDEIWIKDLVPGDIVTIPPSGMQLSFDAALIEGTCIVNESMLTGESVPVTKTPLASSDSEMKNIYNVESLKSHTLFCGTEVIQTRYYRDEVVRALVVRTGYGTSKGKLVHSILFPKPVNLRLLNDAYRFVGVMCAIAFLGFGYSTYLHIQFNESVRDILFKSIDIITITVPPALPLAMTIGIIYAQARLKKVYIHTISPQRINICGQVDIVAFDKTGTLTEEGLDLTDIVPVYSEKFAPAIQPQSLPDMDKKSQLIRCMTTCHSLTIINRELSGDPLDIKMFEATGWKLVEPKVEDESKYDQLQTTYVRPPWQSDDFSSSTELDGNITSFSSQSEFDVGIIRQFPFLSSLQRASVLAKPFRSGPKDMMVYVKGAPEMIAKLCLRLPSDFTTMLKIYTQQGHRVIAMAYRSVNLTWLKAQKVERDVIEKDLNFLGFLVLQNKLKSSSTAVIQNLDNALIRTVMVTGDNLETALCVAKECKILKPYLPVLVPKCDMSSFSPTLTWHYPDNNDDNVGDSKYRKSHLSSSEESNDAISIINMGDSINAFECHIALTGYEFNIIRNYFPEFVPALAVQGAIFARMSPQQKTELMEELEAVDYHTLMCGDGANDCGALKRAHVGLSLSEYEASVAAPFTARSETGIEAVPTLIREGRAALVTSFGMFKFMALYSMIQFTTVLLLYSGDTNLSDYQFLYIDLIIIDVVAVTMSRNHAYKKLHWKKPPASLVCVEMLISLFLQIFLQFGLQFLPYRLVQQQCWFKYPTYLNLTEYIEYENASHHGENVSPTIPANTTCPAPDLVLPDANYQRTYQTTCLFYISSFMYLSVSVAFSRGQPFRTMIYKNKWFLGSLLVLAGCTFFMMFADIPELDAFMDLWHIPDLDFLFLLSGIIIGHFLVSLFIELFFMENPKLWIYIKQKCSCIKRAHKKRYKNIRDILNGSIDRDENGDLPALFGDVSKISIPSLLVGQPIYAKSKVNPFEPSDAELYKTQI